MDKKNSTTVRDALQNTKVDIKQQESTNTDQAAHEAPEPLHQPFSWLADRVRLDAGAQFTELTMDICYGLQTCLELVHAASASPSPVLGHSDADRLLRLAIASTGLLAAAAEDRIEWLNSRASKEPS